jgi:lipid-binding SYLF domain-containing protein
VKISLHLAALSLLIIVEVTPPARAQGRAETTIAKAMELIEDMDRDPETRVPPWILRDALGIAIIPDQLKAGFLIGARYGRGLIVVRQANGTWSNPVFITSFGGSLGLRAGAQATDLILIFKGRRSVNEFLEGNGKLTLGFDASVAAGPIGRAAEAGTDLTFRAEILSYSRNRGAFAGISAGGGSLLIDWKVNAEFYSGESRSSEILAGKSELKTPKSAQTLKQFLRTKFDAVPRNATGRTESAKPGGAHRQTESAATGRPVIEVEGALPAREPKKNE